MLVDSASNYCGKVRLSLDNAATNCHNKASSRFLELYEKIPEQLESLQVHLANLTEYEELFSESSNMQILLEKSYVNVVRFWYRVEKECKRCSE